MKKSHLFSGFVALVAIVSSVSRVHAAVIPIDLTGKTGDNAGVTGYVDIVSIPGASNILYASSNYYGFTGLTLQAGTGGIATTGNTGNDQPIKFNAGDIIGSSSSYDGTIGSNVFKSNVRTVADFGANSFLGFKDSLGRYGYIEVTWDSTTDIFRMISAAYESDPGVAIQTPGGAVPEPTSMAMFLLGALGVAYRTRRKSKA